MSVWFITGASRGLGQVLTKSALAHGDQVVATARDPRALPRPSKSLFPHELDVTNPQQATDAVTAAVERFGRIDVLVNNAGYGLFGAVEEISDAEARTLFDTNVFGLLNVTRAALPTLRAQGAGRILNIGSSAGFGSSPGRGLYSAAKFAVEGITEALRAEVAPLGIHVTVVEPGSFRTNFLSPASVRQPTQRIPAYTDTVGPLRAALTTADGHQPGDPDRAATAIRQLAAMNEPPLRLPLGTDSVNLIDAKLAAVSDDLAAWRDLSISTDFPA